MTSRNGPRVRVACGLNGSKSKPFHETDGELCHYHYITVTRITTDKSNPRRSPPKRCRLTRAEGPILADGRHEGSQVL